MDAFFHGVSKMNVRYQKNGTYFHQTEFFPSSKGEGEDGKLGHNNRITLDKPKLIEALRSKRIRDIACGSSHSAAITTSGELYCWGLGEVTRVDYN